MAANGVCELSGEDEKACVGQTEAVAASLGVRPALPETAKVEENSQRQTSFSAGFLPSGSWWPSWSGRSGGGEPSDKSAAAHNGSRARHVTDGGITQEQNGMEQSNASATGSFSDQMSICESTATGFAVKSNELALKGTLTTSLDSQPAEDPNDPPLPDVEAFSKTEPATPRLEHHLSPVPLPLLRRPRKSQSLLGQSLSTSLFLSSSICDSAEPTWTRNGRGHRSTASLSRLPEGKRLRYSASDATASRWWVLGASAAAEPAASTATAMVSSLPSDPTSATTTPVAHDLPSPDVGGQHEPPCKHFRSPRSRSAGSQPNLFQKLKKDDLRKSSLRSMTALANQKSSMAGAPSGLGSPKLSSQGSNEQPGGQSLDPADGERQYPRSVAADQSDGVSSEGEETHNNITQQPSQSASTTSPRPPASNASSWWSFGFGSGVPAPQLKEGSADKREGEVNTEGGPNGHAGEVAKTNGKSTPQPAADGMDASVVEGVAKLSAELSSASEARALQHDDDGAGKTADKPATSVEPSDPPTPTSSLLSFKGASYYVLSAVMFSRSASSKSGGGSDSKESQKEGEVHEVAGANSGKSECSTPSIDTSPAATSDAQRKSPSSASGNGPGFSTVGTSRPTTPASAPQTTTPVKTSATPLPRTPNYVLPQLPNPPPLGILPEPPTPPPSASQPSRQGVTGYLASTGHTVVSKAINALGNLVWKDRHHDGAEAASHMEPKAADATAPQLPREIGKIAVIGIHGWFPIKLFQKVIGEPTGTSPRFCAGMKEAVLSHIRSCHPLNTPDPEITLIPLEGEGKVLDRVARLHAALHSRPEWVEALRTADCVLVATHSQGAPVSSILLARLLRERVSPFDKAGENRTAGDNAKNGVAPDRDDHDSRGRGNSDSQSQVLVSDQERTYLLEPARQWIGMLTMAGIAHGPFPFLRSNLIVRYIEAEPARELFEFLECPGDASEEIEKGLRLTKRERRRSAELSTMFWKALKEILDKGVKVTCVASMADQVVPLYSATFHALSHPNLYRAVYIDAPPAQEATAMAQTGHKPASGSHKDDLPASRTPSGAPASAGPADLPDMPTAGSGGDPAAPWTNLTQVPAGPAERPSSGDLDFLNNLIVFALRLRNAGLSDHGLIVHLSEAVAGSRYGTGHSTIYEENEVYALAFKWLLHTDPAASARPDGGDRSSVAAFSADGPATATSSSPPASSQWRLREPGLSSSSSRSSARPLAPGRLSGQQSFPTAFTPLTAAELISKVTSFTPPISESQLDYFSASNHLNPYYLPWIIRALLGDPLVAAHTELAAELQGIIRQFRDWEPKEKALRDLKYRLEPLKSHL